MTQKYEEIHKKLLNWFKINGKEYLWRSTHNNPYEILIAEIMLQRTTAISVSRMYEKFLLEFPDLKAIQESDIKRIEQYFLNLGLTHKTSYLKTIADTLKDKYFEIPKKYEDLINLKGIGDYISRAIRVYAFGKIDFPIDSNIKRITERAFNLNTDEKRRKFIKKIIKNEPKIINWALLDIGWCYCRGPKPKCNNCPLLNFCSYAKNC